MERSKKSEYVAKLKQKFDDSSVVLAVTQNKVTVAEVEKLRKRLNDKKSEYFVVKNTLARIAVKGTKYECVSDLFKGQTALVFSNSSVDACKALIEFADASDGKVNLLGGAENGTAMAVDYIKMLAKLPSMDEIRAKIVAVIQTPGGQIARVLKAYSEK